MKDRWNFSGRFANSDLMHYLRFAAVPLAAVILIAVILIADRDRAEEGETAESAQTVLAESAADGSGNAPADAAGGAGDTAEGGGAEPAGADGLSGDGASGGTLDDGDAQPEDRQMEDGTAAKETGGDMENEVGQAYADIDISQYTLKQDEVPELLALVRTYCQAKEDCDPELLARLFGKSGLSEEELAAEKERMELVKASVKRYENISCYSIEGPEPDSYVVFPYFEIQYREAEALMPQLAWVYVTKLDDGSFVMQEEISEDVAAYIARIGEKEDVAAVRAQVADAQASAVASDEKLRSIYSGESEVVIGN